MFGREVSGNLQNPTNPDTGYRKMYQGNFSYITNVVKSFMMKTM